MKKITLTTIFLLTFHFFYGQDYDLIVTTTGDSIICQIDSISKDNIYLKMKHKDNWVCTFLNKSKIKEYKKNVIDKKVFNSESGDGKTITSVKDIRKNSVYYEFLGNGLFFGSVNYDRLIPITKNIAITLRGGISYYDNVFFIGEINMLVGRSNHFFEGGVAYPFINVDFPPMIRAGYRYQGPKGLIVRAAPLYFRPVNDDGEINNIFWFGLSIGYSF